jgi:hypothetical protein
MTPMYSSDVSFLGIWSVGHAENVMWDLQLDDADALFALLTGSSMMSHSRNFSLCLIREFED